MGCFASFSLRTKDIEVGGRAEIRRYKGYAVPLPVAFKYGLADTLPNLWVRSLIVAEVIKLLT